MKILEPSVLTPIRTDYGKAIRKQYESGQISESRHNMTELQPREDEISNMLTTVQKDNLLLEPMIIDSQGRLNKVCVPSDTCPTLRAQIHGNPPQAIEPHGRIRKLTPLECWRLMGFDDADHERAVQAEVSNSQRYKQAGNSIVVNVLEAIFRQMI